jgi:hypothetical protein
MARIYKWVDEEGNVHLSEKPPENVNYAIKNTLLNQLLENAPGQANNGFDLPPAPGSVTEIVARLQDSVVMIISE